MNLTCSQAAAPVFVVDRVLVGRAKIEEMIERLGLVPRAFQTIRDLTESTPLEAIPCLVLDLANEPEASIEFQRRLVQQDTGTQVVLTTDDLSNRPVVEGLTLGAIALLSRPVSIELLADYVRYATRQFQELQHLRLRHNDLRQQLSSLSARQRKVLDLASTGMPNKIIASRVDVSQRTVESERAKVLACFGAESFSDVMIRIGELRVLDRLEEIRQRQTLLRLGMHAASNAT